MAYTDDQRLKMNNDDSVQFIALELIDLILISHVRRLKKNDSMI